MYFYHFNTVAEASGGDADAVLDRLAALARPAASVFSLVFSFVPTAQLAADPPEKQRLFGLGGEKYDSLAVHYAKLHSCSDVDYWSPVPHFFPSPANVFERIRPASFRSLVFVVVCVVRACRGGRGAGVVVVVVALAGWRWRLRFGRWIVA